MTSKTFLGFIEEDKIYKILLQIFGELAKIFPHM